MLNSVNYQDTLPSGFNRLYPESTFNTFSLQFTANVIRLVQASIELVCIGSAAAAAEKSRPAFPAFVLDIYILLSEHAADGIVYIKAVINIAHFELFHADKLMTGI